MPSILAAENQVIIYRGESATISLQILDSNNKFVNLTGGKVIFTVKNDIKDNNFLLQKTSDSISQIELTSPREGKADIFISSADTQSLDTKEYVYDIWAILSSGKKYPVIKPSIFEIKASVTRFV